MKGNTFGFKKGSPVGKAYRFKKGSPSWNKGIGVPWLTGENHPSWKGNKVGYYALHSWIRRKLGKPNTCAKCGKTGLTGKHIHWSNKSGKYTRDLSDWIRLCTPCHKKSDLFRLSRKDR